MIAPFSHHCAIASFENVEASSRCHDCVRPAHDAAGLSAGSDNEYVLCSEAIVYETVQLKYCQYREKPTYKPRVCREPPPSTPSLYFLCAVLPGKATVLALKRSESSFILLKANQANCTEIRLLKKPKMRRNLWLEGAEQHKKAYGQGKSQMSQTTEKS